MIINLNKLKYFYLTNNNLERKTHFEKEFSKYITKEINPNTEDHNKTILSKTQSGASGHLKILDIACKEQSGQDSFKPFAILEDDVKKYKDFPNEIKLPNNTDILFIGLSTWGLINSEIGENNSVFYENINQDLIRVYNMLSTHGYIVCSSYGAIMLAKAYMEAYFENKNMWDIYFARIQPYCNTYALKVPLVYQSIDLGGHELPTKITVNDMLKNTINEKYFDRSSITYQTNYNE